ncbi:MAG: ABC transporter permease [bacterium]
MNLLVNIRIAFRSLGANKLRTALTLLGIIIGVSAVVIVGSTGMSGKKAIVKELESFGLSSLRVWRSWGDRPPGEGAERLEAAINYDDLEAIVKECDKVKRVAPLCGDLMAWARYRGEYSKAQWIATTPDYNEINSD